MKILLLATDVYGANGGIAKFNRDLIGAIASYEKCEKITVLPYRAGEAVPEIKKLSYLPPPKNGNKLSYAFYVLKQFSKIGREDVILCGHIHFIPVAYLLHVLSGAQLYLVIYGIEAWKKTKNLVTNFMVRGISGFISISEFTRDKFVGWTGLSTKNFILSNCVDLSEFKPGPPPAHLVQRHQLQGKKVLMTLARLPSKERYKGVDQILEIMPDLLKEYPSLVYMVCGEGGDRKRLEMKAQSLGVNEHVIFTGFVEQAEKEQHYQLADLFAMPGRGEGFGFVFLEAMACGIPVLGSKLDGSREAMMNGELGIVVDPTDADELRRGIMKGLSLPKGIVPKKLQFFSSDQFRSRCHAILDKF